MHRIVFEIQIKGLPNEVECLSKIRENLDKIGKCVGSTSSYVCFHRDVVIKIVPKLREVSSPVSVPYVYEAIQQAMLIILVIEGDKVDEVALVTEAVHGFARSCGLSPRLIE